tara:strand:- start:1421 stop:2053 length:633 start_codon:yes stop_codon:yes gene_type:complete
MGYQGRYLQPNRAYNNSDVRVLDTFDSTFNGVLTTFNLTESGSVYRTLNAESLFVKLGGIIQTPRVDYTISNSAGQSQITFTTAPNAGLDCEIRVILGAKGRPQIKTDDIDLASTSNPPSPSEGQLYYNTTEDELRVYNGTEWDTAGGGGASKVYSKTVFGYQNVVNSNITIASPYNTGVIYTHEDVTVDIENGIQVDVDDGCILLVIDI